MNYSKLFKIAYLEYYFLYYKHKYNANRSSAIVRVQYHFLKLKQTTLIYISTYILYLPKLKSNLLIFTSIFTIYTLGTVKLIYTFMYNYI